MEKRDKTSRYQILTILPSSWSLRKIMSEFGVTLHEARNAKFLQKNKGFMSFPDPVKSKTSIDPTVVNAVEKFYLSDHVSRMCPGKQDFKVVRNEKNEKRKVQKRLALMTLKECYQEFKKLYENLKIGFSCFACRMKFKISISRVLKQL